MKMKWVILFLLSCVSVFLILPLLASALYVANEGAATAALGAFTAEQHWNMGLTWEHVWLHYSLWAQTYWLYVACVSFALSLIVLLAMYGNRIPWDFLRRRGSALPDDYSHDYEQSRA